MVGRGSGEVGCMAGWLDGVDWINCECVIMIP